MADGPEWVAFHVVDWKSGTSWLPRILRSVYFDICVRIWETAKPVPVSEAKLIIADLPNGQEMIDQLVELGKLDRLAGGALTNERAMEEASKAAAKVTQWRVAGRASARARASRGERPFQRPFERSANELESESESKKPDAKASGRVRKRPRAPARVPASELPDWIPKAEWDAFLEMRKRIKKVPTDHALGLLVKELEKLKAAGHTPAAVLDQSTVNSWAGVFALKGDRAGGKPKTGVNRRTFDDIDYGEIGTL